MSYFHSYRSDTISKDDFDNIFEKNKMYMEEIVNIK